MRLYGVRIFVADLPAAAEFYLTTLGLPLAWDAQDHGAFGVSLENAELIVELENPTDPADDPLVGRFVGASIAVDDIEAEYQRLIERGVRFKGRPKKQDWGGKLAHFRDPAGNVLTLVEV